MKYSFLETGKEIQRNTLLSVDAVMHTFGGISIGSAYTVSLVCDFDKQKPLDCGSATQSAGKKTCKLTDKLNLFVCS
jgi:hypothetical protein